MRPCLLLAVLALATTARANNETSRSTVETTSSVGLENDRCLDHSIKELGMSAKREGELRSWKIGPQFLHPALVPQGGVQVRFEKAADKSTVRVLAGWPGALKAKDTQGDIEDRMRAIASKLAQICGIIHPVVTCSVTPAGGASAPCAAPAQN
jgi:hypothetical protein